MWLLDKNVPIQLEVLLHEFGIEALTAEAKGLGTVTNGELVAAANAGGVSCILTRDRLFSESASKPLRVHGRICVVLLRLPQLRAPAFLAAFREAWARAPIRTNPGQVIMWPE